MNLLFFLTVICVALHRTSGTRELLLKLLSNHDKNIGPDFANVSVHAELYQLLGVDEANGAFTCYLWMFVEWQDSSVSWAMEEENVSRVWLPAAEVWRPDVVVYNLINVFDVLGSSSAEIYVKVKQDGTVLWGFPMVYTASCAINVADFPFDEQTCTLIFGSWNIGIPSVSNKILYNVRNRGPLVEGTFLDLFNPFDRPETANFQANEQWQLGEVQTVREVYYYSVVDAEVVPFPLVNFRFTFKRRPLFYIYTQVIPSAVITLSFIGLFTPSQSDGTQTERVSLGITTLLTMAVFLMMVSDDMPKTSAVVPRMSMYFMMQLIITSVSTATAAFMMTFHYMSHNGHPVPIVLRWIFLRRRKRQKPKDPSFSKLDSPLTISPGSPSARFQHKLNNLTTTNIFTVDPTSSTSGCPSCARGLRQQRKQDFENFLRSLRYDETCAVRRIAEAKNDSSNSISSEEDGNSKEADEVEDWRWVVYVIDLVLLALYVLMFFVFTWLIFTPFMPSPLELITSVRGG